MSDMIGSTIPFARTAAERANSADPRPSIEERYSGRDDYQAQVRIAAARLAAERFLLPGDIDMVVANAGALWGRIAGE
jgi:hypothetical protein